MVEGQQQHACLVFSGLWVPAPATANLKHTITGWTSKENTVLYNELWECLDWGQQCLERGVHLESIDTSFCADDPPASTLLHASYLATNCIHQRRYVFPYCIPQGLPWHVVEDKRQLVGVCFLLSYGFPVCELRSPGLVVVIFNHQATLTTTGIVKGCVFPNYEPC